jgi:hypothetical protein
MSAPSETQILCEGFHDRAFWAGWLQHLGCSNQGYAPDTPRYPQPDPWGTRIGSGHFAYSSPTHQFIRIIPCKGKPNILPALRERLKTRTTRPLLRIVVNVDPDIVAGSISPPTGLRAADLLSVVQTDFDPAAKLTPAGEIEIDSGATKVSLIRWEVPDPSAPGIPDQQTLERLVCSAVVAAYPDRADVIEQWLKSRPTPPASSPKEYSWSYMAGWYAEHGCEDFYRQVWREPTIARELENRLRPSSAWNIAELAAQ